MLILLSILATFPDSGQGLFDQKSSCSKPVHQGEEPWLVFIENCDNVNIYISPEVTLKIEIPSRSVHKYSHISIKSTVHLTFQPTKILNSTLNRKYITIVKSNSTFSRLSKQYA